MAKEKPHIKRDKILKVSPVILKGVRYWDAELLYKKGIIRGVIYNESFINNYYSNESVKRSRGFYQIAREVIKQVFKNQLELML